jgi:hypothetical protein
VACRELDAISAAHAGDRRYERARVCEGAGSRLAADAMDLSRVKD